MFLASKTNKSIDHKKNNMIIKKNSKKTFQLFIFTMILLILTKIIKKNEFFLNLFKNKS